MKSRAAPSQQATQFKQLQGAAETMVAGNREIDRAARETQRAASTAGAEIAESRALIGGAEQHIGELSAAVGRIEERLGSFSTLLKQIGDVAATIETIAKHTRLLALNAAVEAARALRGRARLCGDRRRGQESGGGKPARPPTGSARSCAIWAARSAL